MFLGECLVDRGLGSHGKGGRQLHWSCLLDWCQSDHYRASRFGQKRLFALFPKDESVSKELEYFNVGPSADASVES